MHAGQGGRPALWPEIELLLFVAIAMFLYTTGIGILNGTDVVDPTHNRLMAHVHGGTLGWITTSVFAATLWLFGEGPPLTKVQKHAARWLSNLVVLVFPAFVLAFATTDGLLRPIAGMAALATVAGFFLWTLSRVRGRELSVPHWGFLAALATSVAGGVVGVLWGLQLATDTRFLPTDGEDTHPGTMVIGFLIPVGLAMAEWTFSFPRPPRATRAGVIQMGFPFVGGLVLMAALLSDVNPLAALAILLEVIGVVIFAVRLWPSIRSVDWLAPGPGRHAVVSCASIVFAIGLAQYFVVKYDADFDRVLLEVRHQLLALDHTNFVGVMTNAVFAMLLAITARRGRWRRLNHAIFVGMNAGLVVFLAGLMLDSTPVKQIGAPVMGSFLLLGLCVFAIRLYDERNAWTI